MSDRIVDASAAQAFQADASRSNPMLGWVVSTNLPDSTAKVVARLVTGNEAPYTLVGETLAEIHAQLPAGLVRMNRQPSDPPELLEVWFVR